jgi:serine/threonine protein kinase
MWSFGCIAFELLTGRKAFSNDFEVYQYGAAKRSPKMYFKGLDVLAKHYLSGLLEVDPEKRPSARALLKEKFLTETPSADSAATVRAQKRRRASLTVSFATSTEPSSLLKASWDWAVSNRQLDLILGLIEAGLEPANSSEAYDALDAFRADWDSSSYIRLGRFVNLYEAPSMISKSGVGTLESGDFIDQGKSSENAFALDTTQWSMSAMSRLGGSDWLAICANNLFDISDVHTEPLQSVLFPFDAQLQFSEDGKHFAY